MGAVPGRVINQFAMDEHDDHLRIATTRSERWSRFLQDEDRPPSTNNLYVLNDDMEQVGAVTGLAPGEQIYSVRFMQGRAYMVTFETIDPLFVIDVSDHQNPQVLGELKIPGFSNYLHPYDEDHIIGFGRDTKVDEYGRVRRQGLKLSLFDVSDVSSPKEVDVEFIGDERASSIAEHDHHAFLFSKEKNLLVIPVTLGQDFAGIPEPIPFLGENIAIDIAVEEIAAIGSSILPRVPSPSTQFRGAFVFDVTDEGFTERGRIEHSSGSGDTVDYWRGYSYYDSTVRRSLYIDDVLYTFSHNYLKMNDLDSLDEVKELPIEKKRTPDEQPDFEIIN